MEIKLLQNITAWSDKGRAEIPNITSTRVEYSLPDEAEELQQKLAT